MSACPNRCSGRPHLYGQRSECMFCGCLLEEEDPSVKCQRELDASIQYELRFARAVMLVLVVAIIIAATLSLTGCASDDWSRRDTVLQVAATATLAVDAYQTSRIRDYPGKEEIGLPRGICGPRPSDACTLAYFGSVAISHWIISRALPKSWRPYWQAGLIVTQSSVIYQNYHEGIR